MKKKNNIGVPLLNQTADSDFNKESITYTFYGAEGYGLTQVYSSNNSIFLASLIRFKRKKAKGIYQGVYLSMIEIRSNMPMVEFIFKLSSDPEFKVIPRTPMKLDETELMFPIDDDDEAEVLELCQEIIKHLDLTKLKYAKQ